MKTRRLLLTLLVAFVAPWTAFGQQEDPIEYANSEFCQTTETCELSYVLSDAYGYNDDGYPPWDGSVLNVIDVDTETIIASLMIEPNKKLIRAISVSGTIPVTHGQQLRFEWVPGEDFMGEFDYECGFVITDINGEEIISHQGCARRIDCDPPTPGVLGYYTVDCIVTDCRRPTNITVVETQKRSVTLNWTQNGPSSSWLVYYKAEGEDTWSSAEASTHTNFVLGGLTPETTYTAKICNVCEVDKWSREFTFTTAVACSVPTDVAVSDIMPNMATVSCNSDAETYNIRFKTSNTFVYDFETAVPYTVDQFTPCTTYDGDNAPTYGNFAFDFDNENYIGSFITFDNTYDDWAEWTSHSGNAFAVAYAAVGVPNNDFFILPEITIEDNFVFSFWAKRTPSSFNELIKVGVYGGDGTFTNYLAGDATSAVQVPLTWTEFSYDLSDYVGQTIRLAINYVSDDQFAICLDDIFVGDPAASSTWFEPITDVTIPYDVTLEPNNNYQLQVQAVCGGNDGTSQWSDAAYFSTPEKMMVTEGNWNIASNWIPEGAPTLQQNIVIRANATVPNGCVAKAKSISFEGTTVPTLTINEGGQLMTDNSVNATVKKSITAYTNNKNNYYLIANPLQFASDPTSNGMVTTASQYDLYSWNNAAPDSKEWINYKAGAFDLNNGSGYLYANSANVELSFMGKVRSNNTPVVNNPEYNYSATNEFGDWNLYGNPFVCEANITLGETSMAYYKMNAARDGFEATTSPIAPLEGFFVQATAASQDFTISRAEISKTARQLNIVALQGRGQKDNAIVRFDGGNSLEKFSFRTDGSQLFIPMEGKDYAVVNAGNAGEIPLSFKAADNDTYTLGFDTEGVSFNYLHLIDNVTGNEVDLLANPTYTFEARNTDYASRFRLVFTTGQADDVFAFCNNGKFIISNEGNATLQVIDVNGRILSSESINGSVGKSINAAPGIYMIRLINGDSVKVQKVVVK